jgi:hypothetical protein
MLRALSAGDEFGLRRPSIFPELLHVPAAGDDEPRARLHRFRRVGDARERVDERRRAYPVDLGGKRLRRADGVQVRVDQARDHRAALQIDDARLWSGELAHVCRRPQRRDFAVTDRQRLADGRLRVDGHDLAVDENRVGRLRVNGGGEECENDDKSTKGRKGGKGRMVRTRRVFFFPAYAARPAHPADPAHDAPPVRSQSGRSVTGFSDFNGSGSSS